MSASHAADQSIHEASAKGKPNILFIMCDDHATAAVGAYGKRLAQLNPTPNLDRLASAGMVFENVFCVNSICTPSRASIMTGQYSHRNKVFDLYDSLPGEKSHLSREMQQAGYATAVVGKWHLKQDPAYFDYYAVLAGQGKYYDPIIHVSEGGTPERIRFDSTLTKSVPVVHMKGHSSDVITDLSLEWLENGRDKSKPFFLMQHFKAPHDMFEYARRYEGYLADVEIPEPSNLYDQPGPNFGSVGSRGSQIGSTVSSRTKKSYGKRWAKQIDRMVDGRELSDKERTHLTYQLYLKKYLRCVKGIDDNLQRLLNYLQQNDLMDNTVIIYTSDQGMCLGEHDFIDKRWMYEESIHMPLIIHYPPMVKAGARNDWLINNTDFAPTLLELAGVGRPDYMQGHSVVGALKGQPEPEDWRTSTYYRYWMHMAHHYIPAHFGIRTKRYKLIFYYGSDFKDVHNKKVVAQYGGNRFGLDTPVAWEFYDLERDPAENHNRYDDPEYKDVIASLKRELAAQREQIGDTDDEFPRILTIVESNE
ncbi:MAG: sulfatase [Verrucomicrobiota bacterium]